MALGPLLVDIAGIELTAEDRAILSHPLVGGVILFSRNYVSPAQLHALTQTIHALRKPPLLIAVDHEGGRVQRFREQFTALPPCRAYGRLFHHAPKRALTLAEYGGKLLAAELRALGVDFSFAPVLDLYRNISTVIGNRAFHRNPEVVAKLGLAMLRGMQSSGMAAVAKHFPGHGAVAADSHTEVPHDDRPLADILEQDIVPFARLIRLGLLAMMPAHVIFTQVDTQPAGFSAFWLKRILRGELGFHGAVLSDDLNMVGASVAGGMTERVRAALSAGCDMALICNNRPGVMEVLDHFGSYSSPLSQVRLLLLHGRHDWQWPVAALQPLRQALASLETELELPLQDDNVA